MSITAATAVAKMRTELIVSWYNILSIYKYTVNKSGIYLNERKVFKGLREGAIGKQGDKLKLWKEMEADIIWLYMLQLIRYKYKYICYIYSHSICLSTLCLEFCSVLR